MRISSLVQSSFLVAIAFVLCFAGLARASETNGTITGGDNNGYAWSSQAGWINFAAPNGNIVITDSGITGHAWNANYGWINMSPTNGGISVAANGLLSGYAWGSGMGWINFSGVSINSSGKFVGQASGATIGTLTYDCTNCDVRTDFRPSNFRTISTPTQSVTVSGGGGGGGGIPYVSGPGGQSVPAHIYAYNVPMKLFPAQSGTLTRNLAEQKIVIVDVPANVFSDEITFIVEEVAVSEAPSAQIQVIGESLFNVFALDKNGARVRTFEKPIKIIITISEAIRGRTDLAVYYFNEEARAWTKISDAVFSGNSASFFVDHLTLFGIFAGPDLPLVLAPTFQLPIPFEFEIPRPEIEAPGGGEITTKEAPTETGSEEITEEKPPLFDIEVSPGPSESKKTKALVVFAALFIVAAGIAFYVLKRRREKQQ